MHGPKPIEGFPGYFVTKEGHVYSERSGDLTIRRSSLTRNGAVKITLYADGAPFTLSLARIVAKAWLYNDHDPEIFDTPIHLDNDLQNNHVDNLAWRPRWFAVKYQRQYWNLEYRNSKVGVIDTRTNEDFRSVMDACQKYGLLFVDIINSCTRGTYVFPTNKTFAFLR